MGETTKEERDEMRRVIDNGDGRPVVTLFRTEAREAVNDADRLAAIERDVQDTAIAMQEAAHVEANQGREGNAHMMHYWAKRVKAILDPPEGA